MSDERLRLVDILTTAAAAANYQAASAISANNLLDAVEILSGRMAMADLGRPQSPLVASHRGPAPVEPGVQSLVQRWFEHLGRDVNGELDPGQLEQFQSELRLLQS